VEVFGDLLNEKNIDYLMPFTIFDVGLQSTNPTVLKNIRRTFNREKFVRGVDLLKRLNRQVNLYLIMGLPGETVETYLAGIRFIVGLDPRFIFLNRLCVLSGTELRERAAEFGLRYDSRPPYLIEATPDMAADDIQRLELFGNALMAEHNLKIGN
jgi:anaerobic magnesium-protoporphyrin IX monomethyl ester cyclase